MTKYRIPLIVAFFSVLFFAINGLAASIIPANLAVDFRDSAWNGANGQVNWMAGVVTAAANGNLAQRTYKLYQDNKDGLGISSYNKQGDQKGEIDEINKNEYLTVGIDGGMYLTGVWITDLYDYDAVNGPGENFKQDEYGHLLLNGNTIIDFKADNNGQYAGVTNGDLWVDFGGSTFVNSIKFYPGASSESEAPTKNEYSVAGFTAVPIPHSILLLFTGLAGLSFSVRKRQRKLS